MAGSPPPPPEGHSGDRWQDSGAAPPPPPAGQGYTGQGYAPGQPYEQGPGGPRPSSNGVAVGALVCGILALLTGLAGFFLITLPLAFILGIVGIVLGVMGIRRAARSGIGKGQGIAGIVTGAIGLLAAIAWVAVIGLTYGAAVEQFGDPFEDPEGFQERLEEFEEEEGG